MKICQLVQIRNSFVVIHTSYWVVWIPKHNTRWPHFVVWIWRAETQDEFYYLEQCSNRSTSVLFCHGKKWLSLYCVTYGRGVNFINIFRAAFMLVGPKSANQHCWHDCLFAHSGSLLEETARRTLKKLTPRCIRIKVRILVL